jgi:hypothetical protein
VQLSFDVNPLVVKPRRVLDMLVENETVTKIISVDFQKEFSSPEG